MLYMDIVRSPHAHAKIKKINTAKAVKIPGVLAVIDARRSPSTTCTGLRRFPATADGVAIDEVMYQAQEVCA